LNLSTVYPKFPRTLAAKKTFLQSSHSRRDYMSAKRTHWFRSSLTLLTLVMAMAFSTSSVVNGQSTQPPADQTIAAVSGANLLKNPDFQVGGFYFRPPNSLIAWDWFRWDVTRPDGPNPIPEFIDGGSIYHNACYPEPPAGGLCKDMVPNNHSQGYIKYGGTYIAGVWQPVQVTACMNYQFSGYVRTDDAGYRPKVGIDPTGWQQPPKSNPGPGDYVCPPTGSSLCPKDHFSYESDMPSTIVWSAFYTYDPPTPPIYWRGPLSVTTEALSTTITVWTYAAPTNAGSQSTYWDHMSLVQVPPANGKLIADGELPAADGSITNVTTQTTSLRADLTWQTSRPALTQVIYHYVGDAAMPAPPPIANVVSEYELASDIDATLSTNHSLRLRSLRPLSLYDFVILSRGVVGSSCQTSVYVGRLSTTDLLVPAGTLPTPGSDITGATVLPYDTFAYVVWQSAQSSYDQVLYNYNGDITGTIPATMTQQVYLPLISTTTFADSTTNYALHTKPGTSLSTLHIVKLTQLEPDSVYTAVAISAWGEGDPDEVAVSPRLGFQTVISAGLQANLSPSQLADQLQACLAGGKLLEACAGEIAK
jgi:hypothetical protein